MDQINSISPFKNPAFPQLFIDEDTIFDCNEMVLSILCFPDKKYIKGLTPSDISPDFQPDGITSHEKAQSYIKEALNTGLCTFEWLHRNNFGKNIHTTVFLSRYVCNNKTLLHAAWIDISKWELMANALAESEKRYRLLKDLTFEGILIHDYGIVIDCNQAFCAMFGYERDEVLSRDIIELIIHRDYQKTARDNFTTQEKNSYEVRARNKSGELIWIEIIGTPYNFNGNLVRAVAVRNINDKKMIEIIRKENEEKFRRITESIHDIVIITDVETRIKFVSPSITRYSNFTPEELEGKYLRTIIPPNVSENAHALIHKMLSGRPVKLFETTLLRKDSSIAFVETSIAKTINSTGEVELEFYCRDISEQKKLQREVIITSERERRRIGQDIHDGLGQILVGISMMISTLAKKINIRNRITSEEIDYINERVHEAITATQRTVNGLCPVALEKGGLTSALTDMTKKVSRDLDITCSFSHRNFTSSMDYYVSTQLYYIVQEAINNAIRHGHSSKIDVNIIGSKRTVKIVIRNDMRNGNNTYKSNGMGLKTMRYRAQMIGATFKSTQSGTHFQIELNLNAPGRRHTVIQALTKNKIQPDLTA